MVPDRTVTIEEHSGELADPTLENTDRPAVTSIELRPLVPDAKERLDTIIGLYESGSVSFSQVCTTAVEGYGTSGAATALTLRMAGVRAWQVGDGDLKHALENGADDLTWMPGFEAGLYRAICRRLGLPDDLDVD